MIGVLRRGALLACVYLALALPSVAVAHTDPFEPDHTHAALQQEGGTGNGAVVGIGVAVLMVATAAGLIALKRVGPR